MISGGGETEGERLIAYVVAADLSAPPSANDLRRAAAGGTAEHMTPEIRFVDAIPRLSNFKPDLVRLSASSDRNVA